MWDRLRTWHVLLLAGAVRLVLLLYAEYQDAHYAVKYTDIDYMVFTDAARYVAEGRSPFLRSTYRYSPLLAYLMLLNIWVHPASGKVLFCIGDLVAAGLIAHLLKRQGTTPAALRLALLAWLFHPLTAAISTRGSCDVLSVLLLLVLLAALLRGWAVAGGVLYGFAVHFRIYPVIYGPSAALFLIRRRCALLGEQEVKKQGADEQRQRRPGAGRTDELADMQQQQQQEATGSAEGLRRRHGASPAAIPPTAGPAAAAATEAAVARAAAQPLPALRRRRPGRGPSIIRRAAAALAPAISFGLSAVTAFALLGLLFYRLYGPLFVQEAFVHHLTRRDPRHNFSPYYLPMYYTYSSRTTGADMHGAPGRGTARSAAAAREADGERVYVPGGSYWERVPDAPAVLAGGATLGQRPEHQRDAAAASAPGSGGKAEAGGSSGHAKGGEGSGSWAARVLGLEQVLEPAAAAAATALPEDPGLEDTPRPEPATFRAGGGAVAAVKAAARSALRGAAASVSAVAAWLGEPANVCRLAGVPQALLLGALSLRFHADLPACWMLQTLAFVTFNKVVTAQYFVWYFSLLPLVLPALLEQRRVIGRTLAAGGALWVACWAHWLAWAYQLEFKGRSVHVGVWTAGLLFMAANTGVLVLLAVALRPAAGGSAGTAGHRATFLDHSLALQRRMHQCGNAGRDGGGPSGGALGAAGGERAKDG